MRLMAAPRRARRLSRGLSLVELMVGIAVSLFVVAAASLLVSTQLTDNRRLLLETQLQQDLRATADIITRDLRRSGYWQNAEETVPSLVDRGIGRSPYTALAVDPAASSAVTYRYRRTAGSESFGFKLENGVIKSCQGESAADCNAGWQDLTDGSSVLITGFSIATARPASPGNGSSLTLPCPSLCADGTTNCWPRVQVRELTLSLAGTSRSDSTVRRTLTTSVRVRNDNVSLSAETPADRSCPIS